MVNRDELLLALGVTVCALVADRVAYGPKDKNTQARIECLQALTTQLTKFGDELGKSLNLPTLKDIADATA